MVYRFETYPDAEAFLRHTRAALEADEVRNSLTLGLVGRAAANPSPSEPPWYFAAVFEGDRLVTAASKTPGFSLIFTGTPETPAEAVSPVLKDLRTRADQFGGVAGVNGPAHLSGTFAKAWLGEPARPHIKMRMYMLRKVDMPPGVDAGRLRLATEADLELVTQWAYGFQSDAFEPPPLEESRHLAEARIGSREVYLWHVAGRDDPASMAARARPTANGIWVNLVYTPPELRGRGYATACTAALSQLLLDEGKKFCMLFTDLANPTSNSIYQKIGYRPVMDFDEYRFA